MRRKCYHLDRKASIAYLLRSMTTDKSPILIRVPEELKAELREAARQERRSVSNLIETVMAEWLNQRSKQVKK